MATGYLASIEMGGKLIYATPEERDRRAMNACAELGDKLCFEIYNRRLPGVRVVMSRAERRGAKLLLGVDPNLPKIRSLMSMARQCGKNAAYQDFYKVNAIIIDDPGRET